MVPGGVMTVSGRNAPEFTSVPGSRKDLMMVKAPVGAMAGPTLVGPAVWGEVPGEIHGDGVARDDRRARGRVRGSSRSRPLSRCAS